MAISAKRKVSEEHLRALWHELKNMTAVARWLRVGKAQGVI